MGNERQRQKQFHFLKKKEYREQARGPSVTGMQPSPGDVACLGPKMNQLRQPRLEICLMYM